MRKIIFGISAIFILVLIGIGLFLVKETVLEGPNTKNCKLIFNNGNTKINLFFLPALDATIEDFEQQRKKVKSLAEELFQIIPFDVNKDKFNFYYLEINPDFNCEVGSETCPMRGEIENLIQNKCGTSPEKIHQIIVFRKESPTSAGKDADKPPGYGTIYFNLQDNGKVLAHELGHAMANLGDEYPPQNGIRSAASGIPAPNLDTEGCPKWCTGVLDYTNEFYQYYAGWKNCIESHGLDLNPSRLSIAQPEESGKWNSCWEEWEEKYYNAANSEEFRKECPYKPITTNLTIRIGEIQNKRFDCELGKKFDDLNLGTDCIGNTGCYFTALGVNRWRQLENSIMRLETLSSLEKTKNVRFGDYSKKVLQEIIDKLAK